MLLDPAFAHESPSIAFLFRLGCFGEVSTLLNKHLRPAHHAWSVASPVASFSVANGTIPSMIQASTAAFASSATKSLELPWHSERLPARSGPWRLC
jgi:hypothetical protein